MGKIHQGILGGFNGKTGSVVGASWKGIAYMRGKAQSIKNPRTVSQQANRSVFGKASDFFSKISRIVDMGFKSKAVKMSGFNYAVKENLRLKNFNIVSDKVEITLSDIVLSEGESLILRASAATVAQGVVSVPLTITPPVGKSGKAILVLTSEDGNYVSSSVTAFAADATSVTATCPAPSGMSDSVCFGYSFLYFDDTKEASSTYWVGDIQLA